RQLPVDTLQRVVYNHELEPSDELDLTVGFDMDGYLVAGRGCPHAAALKGVIADEARFEKGWTRLTMGWQAECERRHVQLADRVVSTSRYSAGRAAEFYKLRRVPRVVPELIDLADWRSLLQRHPAVPRSDRFTVLCVARLYRRKRIELLLD